MNITPQWLKNWLQERRMKQHANALIQSAAQLTTQLHNKGHTAPQIKTQLAQLTNNYDGNDQIRQEIETLVDDTIQRQP